MSSALKNVFKDIRCIGHTEDGNPVFNGEDVFKLMDSRGVPLEITVEALRGRGAFDLHGFIQAAKVSGNYSNEKLKTVVLSQERLHEVCAKMVRKED